MIPEGFSRLQSFGVQCSNYYWNAGGEKIGITHADLASIGILDEGMYLHYDVVRKIINIRKSLMSEYGWDLLIKDAWRPLALYRLIIEKRRERGLQVEGLFNFEKLPHSTGLAVDAVLTEQGGKPLYLYDLEKDGPGSRFLDFYNDPDSIFFHRQKILHEAFLREGFEFGEYREVWHFQLIGITPETPRF